MLGDMSPAAPYSYVRGQKSNEQSRSNTWTSYYRLHDPLLRTDHTKTDLASFMNPDGGDKNHFLLISKSSSTDTFLNDGILLSTE
jgi:hypothetical protein